MRYLSLFSGIGGFEIGINEAHETLEKSVGNSDHAPERAGDWGGAADLPPERPDAASESVPVLRGRPECVGFSEIDRHASSVYQRNFPGHNALGDITKIDAATLPEFDLLVGGFPCQAFSVAGKRLGFDDTRGTLFFEIARILAVKKPRNFVLENVRGLLSHDAGRTFRTILGTLNDLGYGVEWQVLNSKDFGVPQNRERVYIVGHFGGIPERKVFPLCGGADEAAPQNSDDARRVGALEEPHGDNPGSVREDGLAATLRAGLRKNGPKLCIREQFPVTQRGREFHERVMATTLDANYYKGLDAHQARAGIAVLQDVHGVVTPTGVNWPSRGPEPRSDGLACSQKAGESGTKNRILDSDYRIRRLTPTECCRLQHFPDSWCDLYADGKPVSDSQKYKMLGNAVTTSVVAAVISALLYPVDNSLDTETSRA